MSLAAGAMMAMGMGGAWAQSVDASGNTAPFYGDKEAGWFWYEDPAPEEEEPPEQAPVPQGAAPAAEPAPMSIAWLQRNLPILRDRAIDHPTRENVAAYYYAQRIMMDKAQVFSDMAREVTTTDPLLDENLRVPFAAGARAAMMKNATRAKEDILREISTKAGLWVFHDETCDYCKQQVGPINELAKRYGFTVMYLSRQGGPVAGLDPEIEVRPAGGRFERLGINYTPSIMLAVPPDGYYLIAQGFASLAALETRIISAADRNGLISKQEYYEAVPTAKGVLTAEALEDGGGVDWNSPEQWVPYLQKALRDAYGLGDGS